MSTACCTGGKRKLRSLLAARINRTFICRVSLPLGDDVELLYTSEKGVGVVAILVKSTAVPGNLFIFFWYE